MSKDIKSFTREIDTVTVKGSEQPLRIYTTNLEMESLEEVEDRFVDTSSQEKKK